MPQKAGTSASTPTLERRTRLSESSSTGCRSASSRCRVDASSWQQAERRSRRYQTTRQSTPRCGPLRLEYGMEIGRIFAFAAPDMKGAYLSRVYFRSVTENYLRRCSHLFGCNWACFYKWTGLYSSTFSALLVYKLYLVDSVRGFSFCAVTLPMLRTE